MKTDSNHPFSKEGYDLMAAAFAVHDEIGGGLLEEIYQECLELELGDRGIPFKSKQELAVFFKGRELKKRYIPDLYVFDGMVAELKAVSTIAPEHEAQLINYLGWRRSRLATSSTSGQSKASSGSGLSFEPREFCTTNRH